MDNIKNEILKELKEMLPALLGAHRKPSLSLIEENVVQNIPNRTEHSLIVKPKDKECSTFTKKVGRI